MEKLNYDKLFLIYIILFSLFLIPIIDIPSIMSDDGTHMLLSLFYRNLITTTLGKKDFSLSKAYEFSLSYLIHYPKLQVFYPPLYHLSTGLIFYSILGISSFSARFSNFFFGILSMVTIYIFSSSLLNKKAAFLSVLVFSLNPMSLSFIRLAMKDFTAIFFSLLSLFFFTLALKNKKWYYFFLVGILAALAVLSDMPAVTAYMAIFLLLLMKKNFKNILIFLVSSFLLLAPYGHLISKIGGMEINIQRFQLYGLFANFNVEEFILLSPIMAILLISFYSYISKKKLFWKELLIWFAISFIIIFFMSFKGRFFQFFLLPAYIVIGYFLSKRRKFLILILALSLVISIYLIKTHYFPTYPVKEISKYIFNNLPKQANVAIMTEKDDTLYSSSFMFPLASLDRNKSIVFLRSCYFANKDKEQILEILKDNGVYFVIAIKNTPEHKNVDLIKDELEKVLERDIIEVYKFNNFSTANKTCNFICTTQKVYCTKFYSPYDVYKS